MTKHSTLLHYAVGALLCASLFKFISRFMVICAVIFSVFITFSSNSFAVKDGQSFTWWGRFSQALGISEPVPTPNPVFTSTPSPTVTPGPSQTPITGGGNTSWASIPTALNPIVGVGCDCQDSGDFDYCTGSQIIDVISYDGETHTRTVDFSSNGGDGVCGQFANGDYFAGPAVGETSLTIASMTGTCTGNSCDGFFVAENPDKEANPFLPPRNSRDYDNYDANTEVSFPITFDNSVTSLMGASRSATDVPCGTRSIEGSCIRSYFPLTILNTQPANSTGLIRPSVYGLHKFVDVVDDLNWDDWLSYSYFTAPNLSSDPDFYDEAVSRLRGSSEGLAVKDLNSESLCGEGDRACRSEWLLDDYAATSGLQVSQIMAQLMDEGAITAQKEKAIAALLTFGKDLTNSMYADNGTLLTVDGAYGSGAGQFGGKLPTMIAYALMTTQSRYKDALSRIKVEYLDTDLEGPQEFQQIWLGVNGAIWGDSTNSPGANTVQLLSYWEGLKGKLCFFGGYDVVNVDPNANDWFWNGCPTDADPSFAGARNLGDPHRQIDGSEELQGRLYQVVTAGGQGFVAALMMLNPEVESMMNYQPLIDYSIRYRQYTQIENDSCAAPDPVDFCKASDFGDSTKGACETFSGHSLYESCSPIKIQSTGAQCGKFGLSYLESEATWGPQPDNPELCIETNTKHVPNGNGGHDIVSLVSGDSNYRASGTGRFDISRKAFNPPVGSPVSDVESNWSDIVQVWQARQ